MTLVSLPTFDRLPSGHATSPPDPRRSDPARLAREIQIASRGPLVGAILEAVDAIVLVLDENRQTVAFSGSAARAAGLDDLCGRRPGEVLACVNAQAPGGCGTPPACSTCGALGAIVASRRSGRPTEAECLIRSVAGDGAWYEFAARAVPITVEGVSFTVLSLRDVSAEKRRDALEQVFFHDVLNTVAGLRGWATLLRSGRTDVARASERIDWLSRQIEREIRDHRDLVLAESGALVPAPVRMVCAELLRDVEAIFSSHLAARDRTLSVEVAPPDLELVADPSLLLRVLVNMVRNALEATAAGGTVRVRAAREHDADDAVRFVVHNQAAMPPEVQRQVFVRSFSTKGGRGRGLGTYGMKLIGERYLGGEVSFSSTPEAGTSFWIRVPLARAA